MGVGAPSDGSSGPSTSMAGTSGLAGRSRGSTASEVGGGSGDACWQRSITGYCKLMTDSAVAEAEKRDRRRGRAEHRGSTHRARRLRLCEMRGCRAGSPTYRCAAWNRSGRPSRDGRTQRTPDLSAARWPLGRARATAPDRGLPGRAGLGRTRAAAQTSSPAECQTKA